MMKKKRTSTINFYLSVCWRSLCYSHNILQTQCICFTRIFSDYYCLWQVHMKKKTQLIQNAGNFFLPITTHKYSSRYKRENERVRVKTLCCIFKWILWILIIIIVHVQWLSDILMIVINTSMLCDHTHIWIFFGTLSKLIFYYL